jgi:hypothetical protein
MSVCGLVSSWDTIQWQSFRNIMKLSVLQIGRFLEQLRQYQLFKKDPALWSWLVDQLNY